MTRGVGGFGKSLLSLSVLTLLGVAGCGQVNVTENPAASSNSPTTPSTEQPDSTNPGTTNPPQQAIGDSATATANGAVLTNTQTTVYNLNAPSLGVGGWQPTALLQETYAESNSPRVVFDASSNGFAAWAQGNDMMVRRYIASSATWSTPIVLDSSSAAARQARIAVDRPTGNAIASWVQSNGTAESFYVSRFDNATDAWSAPELLENSDNAVESGPENSSVAIMGTQAAAAWRQFDGSAVSIYLSRLVDGTWTAPALVDVSSQPALHPEVAVDSNGNASLVWRQYSPTDGEYRIHTRRWNNTTQTFGAVTQLDNEGDRQPRLAFDAAGNGIALWRGGGIYVRRYTAATDEWGPEFTVNDQPGTPNLGELALDEAGNAMVAWVEFDSTGTSVYTRRYNATTDTWEDSVLMENSAAAVNSDKNPTVSLNGDDAVVAWVQQEGASSRDSVYAVKRTAGVWGAVTLLEERDESTDELASTVNAAGNAGVVWIQARRPYQAVYLSSNFVVPDGATWQSLANTLYGVNSVEAGNALQAALGGGSLVAGTILSGLPATLSVTTTVPGYYTVLATDTWSHIAQTVYGVTDTNAIAQLQTLLGNPTLTAGLQLVVPTSYNFVTSDSYSAPLDWDLVNTTATTYHSLNSAELTIPLSNWSAAQLLQTDYTAATSPRVAFDASGNGIAVWAQASDIVARRYIASTATWGAPVVLDSNTNEAYTPRLAVDRATGNAIVSWAQGDGVADSLYVSNFTATSDSWTVAMLLENNNHAVSFSSENSAASKAGEHAAIAWVQSDGTANNVYLSRLVSGTWTAPALIDTGADDAEQPDVAIDANGNATVIWRQYSESAGESRINARRWDNVTQAYGSVLPLDGDGDRQPHIAFDAEGNGFALWGGGAYVRRFDITTGQWGAQVQLHGDDGGWNGEIAVDASGDALATWVQNDGVTSSVYARYYNAGTETWGAAVVIENLSTPVSIDHNLTVSLVNGAGVVAWIQENATSSDVYAARFASGVWGSATLLETQEENTSELTSHVDASSNATVLWAQGDFIRQARSNGTPYYVVPAGATWRSIANTLYGVDSDAAGTALQTAMSNPTLTTGLHLLSPPATLAVTPAVPTYYIVQSGDTWASVTLALYGTSHAEAATALQTFLGNPPLTVGSWLLIPSTLNYSVPDA